MAIKIESLHIYPLKSAKGISLTEMKVVKTGPQYDREWMLVDKNNNFITQRTHSQLCKIEQKISADRLFFTDDLNNEFSVPLERTDSEVISIRIFGKETEAEIVSPEANQWFSNFFQQEVRLVRSPEKPSRYTSGNHGPQREILFPDGYPLLLTTHETLAELNGKLSTPVRMDQFRPNIVVSGAAANDEEKWVDFNLGSIEFSSVKACTRCKVITVNQSSGESDKEVMQTLKSYRTKDDQVIFGRNLIHHGEGQLKLDDELKL